MRISRLPGRRAASRTAAAPATSGHATDPTPRLAHLTRLAEYMCVSRHVLTRAAGNTGSWLRPEKFLVAIEAPEARERMVFIALSHFLRRVALNWIAG